MLKKKKKKKSLGSSQTTLTVSQTKCCTVWPILPHNSVDSFKLTNITSSKPLGQSADIFPTVLFLYYLYFHYTDYASVYKKNKPEHVMFVLHSIFYRTPHFQCNFLYVTCNFYLHFYILPTLPSILSCCRHPKLQLQFWFSYKKRSMCTLWEDIKSSTATEFFKVWKSDNFCVQVNKVQAQRILWPK